MKLYSDCLDRDLPMVAKKEITSEQIAEKIFLIYNSYAFREKEDLQYEIYKKISEEFKIPITSIQLCGSGKIGYSYYKSKPFDSRNSDLDIAIINSDLFNFYLEKSFLDSDGLQNTFFAKYEYKKSFMRYLSHGWLRPDFMPKSDLKNQWFRFFGLLSNHYAKYFAGINAGIFLSEKMFSYRQKSVVEKYKQEKGFF